MSQERELLLEAKKMYKTFGPTVALNNARLNVYRGEVHGLIGENGSGKSTLASIIAGMMDSDRGEMYYKGQFHNPDTMIKAQKKGISMILQESNTIANISVAENIFVGKEELFAKGWFVNRKAMIKAGNEKLKNLGIEHIDAADSINKYSFEDRKLIELTRAISDNTEILIVDETTTALSHTGRELLYKIINKLKKQKKAVLFISHDLEEIIEVCTDLTVLRDGKTVGDLTEEKFDEKKMKEMMVGREIAENLYRTDFDSSHDEKVLLNFNNVSFAKFKDVNLKVYQGEIVGIGGLSGSGMRELGRAAFGLENIETGSVTMKGNTIESPLDAIKNKVGYMSKNRDTEALILDAPVRDNLVLPSLNNMNKRAGFINPIEEKKISQEQVEELEIKCYNDKDYVETLSGGNKQKVSFGKWIAKESQLIIMDCPTRGVDVGVKQSMYQMMMDYKNKGISILMISEELPELIGMSDRMFIIKDSEIKVEFTRDKNLTEEEIIEYMI